MNRSKIRARLAGIPVLVAAAAAVAALVTFLGLPPATGGLAYASASQASSASAAASKKTPIPTPTPISSLAVTLAMWPSSVIVPVGQSFTEALVLNTGTDKVSAADIHITFDPTRLQVQSFVASGTMLPVVLVAPTFDNTTGTASIVLGCQPTTPASGTGTIATITFQAVAGGTSMVSYASTTQTASIGKTGNTLKSTSGAVITATP